MSIAEMFFSSVHYKLSSCELHEMETHNARSISRTLAGMDPWLRLGYTEEGLFGYLIRSDPALNRYAIVVSEETAGVVSIRYPWLRGPYLELLAVFPPHQEKNMGSEIIVWMCDQSSGASSNIWTTVSSFNARALSFYKNIGFTEIAEIPDLVADGFCEILLQKKCP